MADVPSSDVKLEIGHVLFIDIVGYSAHRGPRRGPAHNPEAQGPMAAGRSLPAASRRLRNGLNKASRTCRVRRVGGISDADVVNSDGKRRRCKSSRSRAIQVNLSEDRIAIGERDISSWNRVAARSHSRGDGDRLAL